MYCACDGLPVVGAYSKIGKAQGAYTGENLAGKTLPVRFSMEGSACRCLIRKDFQAMIKRIGFFQILIVRMFF